MFETATTTLDWLGVIVFTITGALVASRKEMDFVGFAVTGIGGGTLRNLLLAVPVFWTQRPAYLLACLVVSGAVFFVAHIPQSRSRALIRLDALGLALFAVAGAETAIQAGASGTVAVVMGVVTATFGGVIRDLLGGVTWLMGATQILAAHRDGWRGSVMAVFQPGEKIGEGAKAMVEDGLVKRFPKPAVVLGQHVLPFPAGKSASRAARCSPAATASGSRCTGAAGTGPGRNRPSTPS